MSDLAIIVKAVKKKHRCDPVHAAIDRTVSLIQEFADSKKSLSDCNSLLEDKLKRAYCLGVGSDSILGLDSCDNYKDWLSGLDNPTNG